MPEREGRLARNEAYFREINESLRDKHAHATMIRSGPLPFVCECASAECTDAVELTLSEYRQVRRNARRFVVVPGHETPEIERVVEESLRHVVVEKLGKAGEIAERLEGG